MCYFSDKRVIIDKNFIIRKDFVEKIVSEKWFSKIVKRM